MIFPSIQQKVVDLIVNSGAMPAGQVLKDLGNQRKALETILAVNEGGAGYVLNVWPPARITSVNQDASGANGGEVGIVVRFEVNPQYFNTEDFQELGLDPDEWLNDTINNIFSAVLGAQPEPGGVTFQLAPDAFELVNFDEGLIAYHLRFMRFCVFDYFGSVVMPVGIQGVGGEELQGVGGETIQQP